MPRKTLVTALDRRMELFSTCELNDDERVVHVEAATPVVTAPAAPNGRPTQTLTVPRRSWARTDMGVLLRWWYWSPLSS